MTLTGIRDAFATLVPRLSKMALKYPGTTMTLLANLLVIMSAHFGESCLAWMRCLSDTYMTNKQRVSYAGLFDDVAASAWYAPGVDYVKYGRLMYGTGNNLFQPDAQMTRAMFVQVLYALDGSPSGQRSELPADGMPAAAGTPTPSSGHTMRAWQQACRQRSLRRTSR